MTATAITAASLINADGSYNVAGIMAAAHRKARHAHNLTLCVLGNVATAPRHYGECEAVYSAGAASVDRRSIRVPASLTYAAELARALTEIWFAARVWRSRFVPVVAPVALAIAA